MTAVLNRVSPHSNSRLASPRLASFLPSSFPVPPIEPNVPTIAHPPFYPLSSFSSRFSYKGRGRGRKATKFGIENYWEGSHRERCPCLSCCPYVYLPFINSRSDNFFSKLRDSGVTHVDTYIACISVPTNVYPYTRGNENDRYFSILLEGRVRLRNFRESEIRARYYRGEGRERIKNRGKIVDDGSQVREWMESTARSGVIRLRSDACSVITARRDSTRVLSICPLAVRLPVKRSDDKLLRPTFLSTGVVVPRPPCKFFRGASSSHHWHASKQASSELRLFSLISIFARRDRIRYYRSFRHSR